MFRQRVSSALLAGVLFAATTLTVRAQDEKMKAPEMVPAPAAAAAPAASPCGSPCVTYKTICCTEWVPETCIVEKHTTKVEYKQECYTAYKCETICVQKPQTVMVKKMVPECHEETRIICKKVPVCEEKTIMQKCTVCQPVEHCVKKCVDKGHWECKCVEVKPGLCEQLFKKKDDCCCCEPCPKTKTVKCWVPCPVIEVTKVCKMEKVEVCKPVTVKCTVYKEVKEEVKVKVQTCKCVTECKTEMVTCYEKKTVPYQATRCVKVCTPCVEKVEVCKMVKHTVMKQVPCEPCCTPCTPCCPAPKKSCCGN
jgi:hypothetical protein